MGMNACPVDLAETSLILNETLSSLLQTHPGVFGLLVQCDLILDPLTRGIATNGLEVLVRPTALLTLPDAGLSGALMASLLDGIFLHSIRPEGLSWSGWGALSAERIRQVMADLGADDSAVCWEDRLYPATDRVDLAGRWGRRICLARQVFGQSVEPDWRKIGLHQDGPCLSCMAGEHRPFIHPQFNEITRGRWSSLPGLPSLAEECLCTVWSLTSPVLPTDELVHGLEWLAQCDAGLWLRVAMARLLPTLGRQGRKGEFAVKAMRRPVLRHYLLGTARAVRRPRLERPGWA